MTQDFVTAKIRAGFDGLDRDGDGVLTERDHVLMGHSVARTLGYAGGSSEEQAVVDAYLRIWNGLHKANAVDADGGITKDEFVASTSTLIADEQKAKEVLGGLADTIMDVGDRRGDGRITVAEYTAFVQGQAPGLTDAEAREAFARLDRDGDGHLTRAELRQAVIEYFTSSDPDTPGNWYFGRPVSVG